MSEYAIRARSVGKQYVIGEARPRHNTLRDALAAAVGHAFHSIRRPRGNAGKNRFWALKDVSFDVRHGEVLGIIGPNGAGKSTLLKILSQITEPTEGEVEIRGRVGCLLEVGTGFHSELTGRENIFLNGAILGMTRSEIERKFDEIVAFAEVERFVDTPVKHFSSGMYLRLGFAVAAHLEPEILIVDEVLAVGDAEFQKRCLGRMGEVAREGRTVIFVTHDLDAIRRLCHRCMLLERGRVTESGEPASVIAEYLARHAQTAKPGARVDLTDAERVGSGEVRFEAASFHGGDDVRREAACSGEPVRFELHLQAEKRVSVDSLAVSIRTQDGRLLVNADVVSLGKGAHFEAGPSVIVFRIAALNLVPGRYRVSLWAGDTGNRVYDYVEDAFEFALWGSGHYPQDDAARRGLVPCGFSVALQQSRHRSTLGEAGR